MDYFAGLDISMDENSHLRSRSGRRGRLREQDSVDGASDRR